MKAKELINKNEKIPSEYYKANILSDVSCGY